MAMAEQTLERELLDEFHRMSAEKRQQLVQYAKGLNTRPVGIPGWKAIEIAEKIGFEAEDLTEIEDAILEARRDLPKAFPQVNFDE